MQKDAEGMNANIRVFETSINRHACEEDARKWRVQARGFLLQAIQRGATLEPLYAGVEQLFKRKHE